PVALDRVVLCSPLVQILRLRAFTLAFWATLKSWQSMLLVVQVSCLAVSVLLVGCMAAQSLTASSSQSAEGSVSAALLDPCSNDQDVVTKSRGLTLLGVFFAGAMLNSKDFFTLPIL
ncbi:unnamed protein product, partial [Polarella glacialis]